MKRCFVIVVLFALLAFTCGLASAQQPPAPPLDESALGELPITGTAGQAPLPKLAILPSLSPD